MGQKNLSSSYSLSWWMRRFRMNANSRVGPLNRRPEKIRNTVLPSYLSQSNTATRTSGYQLSSPCWEPWSMKTIDKEKIVANFVSTQISDPAMFGPNTQGMPRHANREDLGKLPPSKAVSPTLTKSSTCNKTFESSFAPPSFSYDEIHLPIY